MYAKVSFEGQFSARKALYKTELWCLKRRIIGNSFNFFGRKLVMEWKNHTKHVETTLNPTFLLWLSLKTNYCFDAETIYIKMLKKTQWCPRGVRFSYNLLVLHIKFLQQLKVAVALTLNFICFLSLYDLYCSPRCRIRAFNS